MYTWKNMDPALSWSIQEEDFPCRLQNLLHLVTNLILGMCDFGDKNPAMPTSAIDLPNLELRAQVHGDLFC